jgi:hypothetical protein
MMLVKKYQADFTTACISIPEEIAVHNIWLDAVWSGVLIGFSACSTSPTRALPRPQNGDVLLMQAIAATRMYRTKKITSICCCSPAPIWCWRKLQGIIYTSKFRAISPRPPQGGTSSFIKDRDALRKMLKFADCCGA